MSATGARARAKGLAQALEAWYAREGRDLPWRQLRGDPYAVWLSEAMLQQTRVETVLVRYAAMLERFPDVAALSRASEEEVLAAWEGLGYYRRARQLHSAARRIVAEHGGRLPDTPQALGALPGFGPYMTAAVASIAFGQRVAATDANAVRVLARLERLEAPAGSPALLRGARAAHGTVVEEASDPGALNQALMDLGARVCGRRPRCTLCPVRPFCRAFAAGGERGAGALPVRGPARQRPERRVGMAVIVCDGAVLAAVRPPGLLGGLWALPAVELDAAAQDGELQSRLAEALATQWGVPAEEAGRLRPCAVEGTWGFTHRLWRMTAYAHTRTHRFVPMQGQWLGPGERAAAPFGGPDRAVLAAVLGDPARPREDLSPRSASRARPG